MKCPECGHQNRDDAKFCLECGKKIDTICPSCSKMLPPSAKFCDECGHRIHSDAIVKTDYQEPQSYTPKHLADKILTSRSSIEGERKLVTILFAGTAGIYGLDHGHHDICLPA